MEALVRIRNSASLLGPAGLGTARLLTEKVIAGPRRVLFGAGLAALVVAIGANALLLKTRRPAPLFAVATDAGASVAPVAPNTSPAPILEPNMDATGPAAAADASSTTLASAPDTTASIGSAAQAPPGPQGLDRRPAASRRDQIGALLTGKPIDDESHLVRAAQIALAKLGYAVKPDGAENAATRRALRHFERAQGWAPTTEINLELVKRLTAAARGS